MSTLTAIYSFIKHARGDTPWDVEVNADYDSIDSELARPRYPFNSPTVGATTTCDLSLARIFVFTVSQATTVAFTNVPASTFGVTVYLKITNGNAFVVTWPAAVSWAIGTLPLLRTTGLDLVRLFTNDGGTTWYANLVNGTERPTGTIAVDVTQTVSGAGSPVTLKSFTLQAGKLAVANTGIRIRAYGTTANNANAKSVRLSFGATLVQSIVLNISTTAAWELSATIIRTGAATQKAFGDMSTHSTTVTPATVTSPAETLANAIVVKVDCTQVAAGDVICEGFFMDLQN